MGSCPFCQAEISEDLIRFGGTCSSCLGDIPGEETPTDPGAEARAAHEAADRKVLGRRHAVAALIVAPPIGGLIGLAVYLVVAPRPVAEMLDFDDASHEMVESQFVAYVEPEPEVQEVARPASTNPKPRTIHDLEVAEVGGDPDLPDTLGGGREPSIGPATTRISDTDNDGMAEVDDGGTEGLQSGAIQFGIDVGVSRRGQKGIRLTDDSSIIEMIKGVMSAELPRLKSCYEQQLKVNEDLSGRWTLTLVVARDGDPIDIAVSGQGVSDADMETCIVDKVRHWAFQPIRADQPVQKTLTFRPG
ncbi:MAG: AgmX/PglI C-terminal domain-containing protein [Deltaproteobacteria bacterium]|nr:AgmX/PglI C-terminal domain-containing protein [Deltaproteobacteria bacterium]